ncbi:MAG: efflux RND transporter periplasmic adaptor subunit [bacterium]
MSIAGDSRPDSSEDAPAGAVAYLDSALWARLRKADSIEDFAGAWLALQCAFIGDAQAGVIVLRADAEADLEPVAYWPQGAGATVGLSAAADAAIHERRAVIRTNRTKNQDAGSGHCVVAVPVLIDDQPWGVLAVETGHRSREGLKAVIRQLQWGAGWVEACVYRTGSEQQKKTYDRVDSALDIIGELIASRDFRSAGTAVATALSARLDCDRVSVGHRGERSQTRVIGVSHSAQFDHRMNTIDSLSQVMDEALDQYTLICLPERAGSAVITRAHERHAQMSANPALLTVPLMIGEEDLTGAVTLERSQEFSDDNIEFVCALSALAAPLLEEKRLSSMPLAPRAWVSVRESFRRFLEDSRPASRFRAAVVAGATLFLLFAHGDYRVTADAELDASSRRVLAAPYDGFLAGAPARPGDVVDKGAVLARMDTEDLVLEEVRWSTERDRAAIEYRQALALGERAKVNIAKAKMDQADAQLSLVREQLGRARIRAPYDGVVVLGDLTTKVGGALRQGEVLFEVAPLTGYRVIIHVDERDIRDVDIGQKGRLVLSSLPGEKFVFTVNRITPVSESSEGMTSFEVEATLAPDSDLSRLRPGMTGVTKIEIDRRRLIWIWTHRFTEWLRLKAWRWLG